MKSRTLFLEKLQNYEDKKELLQQAILELVDKINPKVLGTMEKLEAATAAYNLAAKLFREFIKSNSVKGLLNSDKVEI